MGTTAALSNPCAHILLICGALASACGGGAPSGPCKLNSDCPEGRVCVEGACVEPVARTCNVHQDCPPGFSCVASSCQQGAPTACSCRPDDPCTPQSPSCVQPDAGASVDTAAPAPDPGPARAHRELRRRRRRRQGLGARLRAGAARLLRRTHAHRGWRDGQAGDGRYDRSRRLSPPPGAHRPGRATPARTSRAHVTPRRSTGGVLRARRRHHTHPGDGPSPTTGHTPEVR